MKKTFATLALALLAGGAFWALADTGPGLGLLHAIQSRLKPYGMVSTLSVPGVGEVPLFVNPDDNIISPWIWSGQVWEPTETEWFVASLREGDVVVDVGANLGYYSVLAGRLVGATGRVYAFEPDPVAFEIARRNVRLNGLDNVVLENKAVSDAPGSIRLYLSPENKGDHRIYQPPGEHRESVEVEAVSLDDYFEGREDSVDFVKVDTQGAELVILKGMLGLLARSPAFAMAIEFSPHHLAGFGATGQELLDVIASLNVTKFDLGMGGASAYPVQAITDRLLLRRFSPRSEFFTNLLLVRGRPDLVARVRAAPTVH